jgi:outer membrane receptor protein involved in Fe transport
MKKGALELIILGIALLLIVSFSFSQSKETGAIEGTVKDDNLEPLPGATVSLSSPNLIGGDQTMLTSGSGKYRFVALPPGTYTVEVSLEGFQSAKRVGIKLSVGLTLTADIILKLGEITEEVVVTAESPLIDLKSSATSEVALTKDYLENIPTGNVTLEIVNLAPGVTNTGSAFGGEENSGVHAQSDGVNNTEATFGSGMAVRLDYNIVEEAKIMGVGAPAEYGGVEGIIANMITKSGGNDFQVHGEFIYQDKSWNSRDVDDVNLIPPAQKYYDINAYLGGPIVKDRLWFFGAFRRVKFEEDVTGYPDPIDNRQNNYFFKLTAQPAGKTRIQAFFDRETWDIDNWNANAATTPEAAWVFDLHNSVWNFSLFHIFSKSTFLEAKVAGYSGAQIFEGNQGRDVPSRYDVVTGITTGNAGQYGDVPMQRFQVSGALSHHAEEFIGKSHDFKIGIQFGSGSSQIDQGFSGGKLYYDIMGYPYAYNAWEGVESDIESRTISFFAQDTWRITDRLTINPGLRYNIFRGIGKNLNETIYKAEGFAPRIGFNYNLFGDNSTVLKAHYGWYFASMKGSYYKNIDDIINDYVFYLWLGPAIGYFEFLRVPLQGAYSMDPDIKHPRQDELTVGIERELITDLSLSVSYILRTGKNFIQEVNTTGMFVQAPYPDPETGQPINVWVQTNPGQNELLYTNPEVGGPYDVVKVNPRRKYQALEFVLNKRFSNRWMLLASYVYSKAEGTFGNEFGGSQPAWGYYTDPNNQINMEGRPVNDPRHMFKLQGTVLLPLDFSIGANFSYISGTTYDRSIPVLLPQGLVYVRTEERGSRRLDPFITMDVRVEKQFNFSTTRVGVFLDAFNLFNRSVPIAVQNAPGPNFEKAVALSQPRGLRLGIRFFFN